MPISALVARRNPRDGSVEMFHVAENGEPDHLGTTLSDHYQGGVQVDQLFQLGDVVSVAVQPEDCVPQDGTLNSEYRIPGDAVNYDIAIAALGRATGCSYVYGLQGAGAWMVAATSDLPAYMSIQDAVETCRTMADEEAELRQRHRQRRSVSRVRPPPSGR